MDKAFRAWDFEQGALFPPSVLDLVPEGHAAHVVRDLVREQLDLKAILSAYAVARGGPPYHPTMMTALLLYAYAQGIRSSRKIARACEERVDFMAVTGMQKPDHATVSEFRRRHLAALGTLFVQVLRLCQKAGLVSLGHVALDGSKVKANASKHKAMSYERMKKTEPELAEEVRRHFEEAEATDRAEDEQFGKEKRGDETPAWVKNKQQRLEKIREAKAALEAEAKQKADEERARQANREPSAHGPKPSPPSDTPDDKAQRNFTDPESKILRVKGTYEQSYNAHAAVDAAHQVIVACDVTNEQNDGATLAPMLDQVKANCGRNPEEISADTGYCSEANLETIRRRRIRGYVATGRQKHGSASATESEDGGRGPKQGPLTRAMRARLRRGGFRSHYRLRKQTVEPVFGQMKACRGFRQFLLRGLAKVRGEWKLACIAHNLLKMLKARAATA
jgi:transposase